MITASIVEAGDRSKVHFQYTLSFRTVLSLLRLTASKKRTKIEQVTTDSIVFITSKGKRRTMFSGPAEEMNLLVEAVNRAMRFCSHPMIQEGS
jgi:hypothetical protein